VGVLDFIGFVCRLSIAEEIGQSVEEKIVYKKIDIVPFVSQVLDWTQKIPNIFRTEKCLILNFG
jgi:hypothetical protein